MIEFNNIIYFFSMKKLQSVRKVANFHFLKILNIFMTEYGKKIFYFFEKIKNIFLVKITFFNVFILFLTIFSHENI